MTIEQRAHVWEGPGGPFEGHLAFPVGRETRSAVLVAPTIMGVSNFERGVARRLAERGHVALVADLYGQGVAPADIPAAKPYMDALNADRPLLAARIAAALDALRARPNADPARIAAVGYCFGGKCVLDLARTGGAVTGVVALHGLFDPPPAHPEPPRRIAAKVLALHGWDDPLATPEQAVAFAAEMTAAGADWQLHAYGHTGHGFTNPGRPQMYVADADRRSWAAMTGFLDEVLVA